MELSVPASMPELSSTLQKILRLAREAIPFDKGAIHLRQEGALWTRAVWAAPGTEINPGMEGQRLSLDAGFCGWVARNGATFLSPRVADEPRLRPANYQGANLLIQSFLGVPLRWEGETIGVLEMDSLQPDFFQPRHVELGEVVAQQAALAIVNARLADDRRRLAERQEALLHEAQLQQAELAALTQTNQILIESSPVGIAVVAADGRVQRANPAFVAAVAEGLPVEGRMLDALLPDTGETALLGPLQQTLREGRSRRFSDCRLDHPTRGPLWFDLTLTPLPTPDGQSQAATLTLLDITHRKRLEEDLRQRNERIQQQLTQLRALYEVGAQVTAGSSVGELLASLGERVQKTFAADGLLLLRRARDGTMQATSALGLSNRYVVAEVKRHATGAGGQAIAQRAPVLVLDVARDKRMGSLRHAARAEGIATALYLPFRFRDEVVGLMALYHRAPHRYSLEEMELLSLFASQATTSIQNAQFYASIVQGRSNQAAILQAMTDGVVALDPANHVIFVNQPLFEMLAIQPPESWIGRPIAELMPQLESFWERVPDPAWLRRSLGEAEGVAEFQVELRNPPQSLELVHAPILAEGGDPVGRLFLARDITQLRASEQMKDELISLISHELRTPLTSILGYSKLLLDRADSPLDKRARWAQHILDKSRLLNRLVGEVLDLSRLNRHHFHLSLSECDLQEMVGRVAEEYNALSETHTVRVEMEGDLAGLSLDPDRIEQLLGNLLSNAVNYSPDGGDIVVRVRRDNPWLQIEVSDPGLGIAPEYQSRVFEPFFRVDNSTTRAIYGTGLGLPLCQGIARAHGGDISLQSEPGKGSTFQVRLPVAA